MGNTSSQPEPYPEIPDDFGDIVPETPNVSTKVQEGKSKNQQSPISKSNASSPEMAVANGATDSSTSNPTKRKRDSEPDTRQKIRKHRKSNSQAGIEPNTRANDSSASAIAVGALSSPSQSLLNPEPERLPAKKPPKPKGKAADEPPTMKETVVKQTPAPESPNLEGSTTPGGGVKKVRGSRTREKDSLKIGFYTPDEVQKIESFKVNFCTTHGISSAMFDEMVQHSERGANGEFPVSSDVISKSEFWNEIYELVPDRDRRSVYRFMRRHFQASSQKAHDWSKEQDEELIQLHAKHGAKWSYIGKLIGRSDDDVTQRWKNKLEHQDTMNRGAWSEEETQTFLSAVEASWNTMKTMFPEKAGKDFYELDERLVVWGNISKEMGYKRSRQQCADKWRKIVRQVMIMRANGHPGAVYDVKIATRKAANWNTRLEGQRKSSQFVTDNSDDDEAPVAQEANSSRADSEHAAQHFSSAEANVESEHEVRPEEDLPRSPESPKKAKKSKSHRKHTKEPAIQPTNEDPLSPAPSKKTKEERKREKKERREKDRQQQQAQEAQEQTQEAARKERKRKRKEEKRRKREEAERLAAEEADNASDGAVEVPEPLRKKGKKSKRSNKLSTPPVEASPSPTIGPSRDTAIEHDDDGGHNGLDSDGGEYDSEVNVKYEEDSDEL